MLRKVQQIAGVRQARARLTPALARRSLWRASRCDDMVAHFAVPTLADARHTLRRLQKRGRPQP